MNEPRPADTARDQVARLLALVPYLHARGEVSVVDAATHFGIAPAQLVKDLKVLFMVGLPGGYPDDLIDVDLDALEGDGIIRVSNADYLARPVRFSPAEATALVVALRTMAETAAPETGEVVRRTLAKLEAVAGPDESRMHVQPERVPGREILPVLEGAIARRHRLEIAYHVPARDEVTARVVDPRAVAVVDGVAYLDAWCHTAQADRAFRVDRIRAATELGTGVEDPDAPARDLTGGWFSGGGTTRATLRLAAPAQWVPEYYPVVESRQGPDGTLDVDLEIASEAWLRQLVLRLAPHARVLAPQEFAESFTAGARDSLSLYEDGGVR
jgi:proteasome accessory factor C